MQTAKQTLENLLHVTVSRSLRSLGGKIAVNIKPVNECIKPTITCPIGISEPEAVTAGLV
jgi:hypothetical protein